MFLFWINIFSKNKIKKKANKFDLIIDDVDHKDILYRFKPFAKKFNSHIFITTFDQINESLYRWNNYISHTYHTIATSFKF